MERTLTKICDYINNYFETAVYEDSYTISAGTVSVPFLVTGQYFRIVGSALNDGIYKYPAAQMHDETFTGAIWVLNIPVDVVDLADDVAAFEADSSNAVTGYTSESFAGYSYSKANDGKGGAAGWQTLYRTRLNRWRKVW